MPHPPLPASGCWSFLGTLLSAGASALSLCPPGYVLGHRCPVVGGVLRALHRGVACERTRPWEVHVAWPPPNTCFVANLVGRASMRGQTGRKAHGAVSQRHVMGMSMSPVPVSALCPGCLTHSVPRPTASAYTSIVLPVTARTRAPPPLLWSRASVLATLGGPPLRPLQAVLESVAELSMPPTTFSIPTKGTYITFKSGGGTHEAHVSVRSVASVALSTEPAKMGGHDLHVMRLLGVGGGPVLSLLVAWAEGEGPGSYVRLFLSDFFFTQMCCGCSFRSLVVDVASMRAGGSACITGPFRHVTNATRLCGQMPVCPRHKGLVPATLTYDAVWGWGPPDDVLVH